MQLTSSLRCRPAPRRATWLLLLVALVALVPACAPSDPREGLWHAWLESPGGELPFGLSLEHAPVGWTATLHNGVEAIPVARTELEAGKLRLHFEPYDSVIEARIEEAGRRLAGEWVKTASGGGETRMAFHALAGARDRFASGGEADDPAPVAGRWAVDFEESDELAVGVFEARDDGSVQGTFLTTTGDYRFLAGSLQGDRLRLSCFDGAHAFLFDARLGDDGTLAGDFWSRDTWHEGWTARRDETVTLPDGFELTRWIGDRELASFSFPDLEGQLRSLDDPAFAGRARLIEIFGSWCPNCNDSARFLVELDQRYRDRGLAILGLAFEHTGDADRDREQVRKFAAHHGIEYPLLVAGVSDKDEASAALPLVDRVRSYPTAIFLDGDGRIRAVHQGYTGPATGEAFEELKRDYVALIEELLQ